MNLKDRIKSAAAGLGVTSEDFQRMASAKLCTEYEQHRTVTLPDPNAPGKVVIAVVPTATLDATTIAFFQAKCAYNGNDPAEVLSEAIKAYIAED